VEECNEIVLQVLQEIKEEVVRKKGFVKKFPQTGVKTENCGQTWNASSRETKSFAHPHSSNQIEETSRNEIYSQLLAVNLIESIPALDYHT
jgi:hypothetical protein